MPGAPPALGAHAGLEQPLGEAQGGNPGKGPPVAATPGNPQTACIPRNQRGVAVPAGPGPGAAVVPGAEPGAGTGAGAAVAAVEEVVASPMG